MAFVWKSQDNFMELVLSFHHYMGSQYRLKVPKLVRQMLLSTELSQTRVI